MPVALLDERHAVREANDAFQRLVGVRQPAGQRLNALMDRAGMSAVDTGLGRPFHRRRWRRFWR